MLRMLMEADVGWVKYMKGAGLLGEVGEGHRPKMSWKTLERPQPLVTYK